MRGLLFYAFSAVAIASAVLCITRRSPVASALWLANTLFQLAGLFVLLGAHFIGFVQILVYVGAVMVLFLFVIMLLNLGRQQATDIRGTRGKVLATVLGLVLAGELLALRTLGPPAGIALPPGEVDARVAQVGAVQAVAMPLFHQYLVAFEVTSVMLLAAIVGAVVLAKRRL
jgi:NADH-quinone oxidoreductase subunit J